MNLWNQMILWTTTCWLANVVIALFFLLPKWDQPPLKLPMVEFLWPSAVRGIFAKHKISHIEKKPRKKVSENFISSPVAPIFLLFCMKLGLRGANKIWVLDFWYFSILTHLGPNGGKMGPKRVKIENYQKSLSHSFMQFHAFFNMVNPI